MKFTYITTFSSAGIGCYGLKREGFECIATNEYLEKRMNVQRANHKCKYETGYITGDITTNEVKQRIFTEIDRWKRDENITDVDLFFATPPCQGMSNANTRKGDETQRNSLITEAVRLINRTKPKCFVFENVQTFLDTECSDDDGSLILIRDYINKQLSSSYRIASKVINFRHRGVPQNRVRTIVIGTRNDLAELSPFLLFPVKQREITLRDCIGNLESLNQGERSATDMLHFAKQVQPHHEEWLKRLKEGMSISDLEDFEYFVIGKDGIRQYTESKLIDQRFRRLRWDEPGHAITRFSGVPNTTNTIHPVDNRVLSIRELMRIDSIPDEFRWCDEQDYYEQNPDKWSEFLAANEPNIRDCIGEAVPTHVMEQVGANLKWLLEYQHFMTTGEKPLDANGKCSNPYVLLEMLNRRINATNHVTQQSVFDSYIDVYRTKDFSKRRLYVIARPEQIWYCLHQLLFVLEDADMVWIDVVAIPTITKMMFLKHLINKLPVGCNVKIRFFSGNVQTHRNRNVFAIQDLERLFLTDNGQLIPD